MRFTNEYGHTKIYADGADLAQISQVKQLEYVRGFTTNPTLMRSAGVHNYLEFAKQVVGLTDPLPVSLEVFADDHEGMIDQAKLLSSLGKNVYVKIPVVNTNGRDNFETIHELSDFGINLNITAVFTLRQVQSVLDSLDKKSSSIISIFAGRIADAGQDPVRIVSKSVEMASDSNHVEILWASPREIFNFVQANQAGADIITMTKDLIAKLPLLGKDLETFSIETSRMFFNDAQSSGYEL